VVVNDQHALGRAGRLEFSDVPEHSGRLIRWGS
jgi:hypothetical protein